jgi:hypothetical protein
VGHKVKDGDVGTVWHQLGDAAPLHPSLSVPVSVLIDQS